MSEPRRSTRARAREEAAPAPAPEPPKDTPSKPAKSSLKRKRTSIVTKDSTPATPVADAAPQEPKLTLPIRLADGQPLPTLPEPQPLDLPSNEYQDIQHSGVLSASLQRSRAVWVSGTNFRLFHAFFAPPKKVADRTEEDKQNMQRQKELVRNFPQIGVEAQLVIEPHTFPIRLYGPREAVLRQPQKKPSSYGHWPSHNNQYSSYQQYNHAPAAPYPKPPPPQQRPPPPKPVQQAPPPPPPPAPGSTTTPAPDPVIHMLAQRAGTDPELKAVMKIVAAGQANKEQLEFFQGHINELTAILQKQKDTTANAPSAPPPAPLPPQPQQQPKSQTQPLSQSQLQPQSQLHQKPSTAPAPAPQVRPIIPPNQQQSQPQPQNVQKTYPPTQPQRPQQMAPMPPQQAPYPQQYNNTYNYPQQYQQPHPYAPISQPPRSTYRPLVFDFVEGNGDKFYLPSYSFMEWLPNNSGVKFSFLITKMKPKLKPEAKEKTPSTPGPKAAATLASGSAPAATPNTLNTNGPNAPPNSNQTPNPNTPLQTGPQSSGATQAQSVTPYVPPPRIEDFDEKKDIEDIEFYQPVTVLILTHHPDILQSLPRAIRPPDVVAKYMDKMFDKCRRAEETYLAFRLPREGGADAEEAEKEKRTKSGDITPAAVSTPNADVVMGGTGTVTEKKKVGRPRKSLV